MSINTLFGIGKSAIAGNQTALNVTGNNIANVNTQGYSRQSVRFEDRYGLNQTPGMLGQGVHTAEIYRNFNRFVEDAYIDRFSQNTRWDEQSAIMSSIESIFNESNRTGISALLGEFFKSWQDLSLRPEDTATREALLATAKNLTQLITDAKGSLQKTQQEMDLYIEQSVNQVNELVEAIKTINKQISANYIPGQQNPNQLLDQRDQLVRELADLVDIEVMDKGGGDFTIQLKSGQPLLEEQTSYSLSVGGQRVENYLKPNSGYTGSISASGSDSHEYSFEIINPPSGGGPGSMRVSLDGGKTWLRNEDGSELRVPIPTKPGETIKVKNIEITFDQDPSQLVAGDRFDVIPKTGLYWNSPTRPPVNITPQTLNDGTENTGRLTGGKLTAYFSARDYNAGRYIDKLDALANSIVWEVNRIHSQGAGEKNMTYSLGSGQVNRTDVPLGTSQSGLAYGNRLTNGNLSFQIYDAVGKPLPVGTPPAGIPESLDLAPGTPGIQNFDPSAHSLEDLVNAINHPDNYGEFMEASIVDGKLQLTSRSGTSFAAKTDTTGLLAALGVNTFFQGSNATDISIKPDIVQDINYINAGKVNANGEVSTGDNSIAKELAELATKGVTISTVWETTNQTLGAYYGSLVGLVGSDTRTAKFNADYNKTLSKELEQQAASITGVNLDEEMTSLIKFQHSYTAAAKLITTADQMLQTLLSLKQ